MLGAGIAGMVGGRMRKHCLVRKEIKKTDLHQIDSSLKLSQINICIYNSLYALSLSRMGQSFYLAAIALSLARLWMWEPPKKRKSTMMTFIPYSFHYKMDHPLSQALSPFVTLSEANRESLVTRLKTEFRREDIIQG